MVEIRSDMWITVSSNVSSLRAFLYFIGPSSVRQGHAEILSRHAHLRVAFVPRAKIFRLSTRYAGDVLVLTFFVTIDNKE
jgi:hypothetical protein